MDLQSQYSQRGPSRPFGVTLLAVLWIVDAIILLVNCLFALSYSSYADSPEGQEKSLKIFSEPVAEAASGFLLIAALAYFVIGISALLVSRGLYRGIETARRRARRIAMFAVVFALLGAILFGQIAPDKWGIRAIIWPIIFNIAIIRYLGSERVRAFFARGPGSRQ